MKEIKMEKQSQSGNQPIPYAELEEARIFHDLEEALRHPEECLVLHLMPGSPLGSTLTDALKSLPRIQSIIFEGLEGLKEIPAEVCELTNLQEIVASFCPELGSLPEGLAQLEHFAHLDISACPAFRALPAFLLDMNGLESLSVDNCALEELPEGLERLERLEELNIRRNRLRTVPKSLFQSTSIRHLRLAQPYALRIPKALTDMKRLEEFSHGVLEVEGATLAEIQAKMPDTQFLQVYFEAQPFP